MRQFLECVVTLKPPVPLMVMPDTRQDLPSTALIVKRPPARFVTPTPPPMMLMPLLVESVPLQVQLPAGTRTVSLSAAWLTAVVTSERLQLAASIVAAKPEFAPPQMSRARMSFFMAFP